MTAAAKRKKAEIFSTNPSSRASQSAVAGLVKESAMIANMLSGTINIMIDFRYSIEIFLVLIMWIIMNLSFSDKLVYLLV